MVNLTMDDYADFRERTAQVAEPERRRLGNHVSVARSAWRPGTVFGSHCGSKEVAKAGAAALEQLRQAFKTVATKLNVDPTVPDPFDLNYAAPILNPLVYTSEVNLGASPKRVAVTAPLKWVLSYPEYPLTRLRELVAAGKSPELRDFAFHYTALNLLVTLFAPGLALFEDLRYPIGTEYVEGCGPIPLTVIRSPIRTVRPSDATVAKICKLSGANNVEEVLMQDALEGVGDPLVARFAALFRSGCQDSAN